ncbi:MAG: hypothetical protein NVS4B7_05820 [Ktedonobacteraceae bacterium]
MARDRSRNIYFTVGLPLDSETYRALRADALQTGVSIPQLLAVRITDWYKLSESGGGIAVLHASTRASHAPETSYNPAMPEDLQARASAAAAAWSKEDGE